MRFALYCAAVVALVGASPFASAADPPRGLALLVGCSQYPNCPQASALPGTANDVLLMQNLLRDKFRFAEADLVILSESAGAKSAGHRPTRANILRELDALASKARKGDRVVVFLSGHGTRQPDTKPDDPDPTRYQPDGLEEAFLPSDIGKKNDDDRYPQAISDYELRDRLKAIRAKGTTLWVVIDACHSASMARPAELQRGIASEKLFSPETLRAAKQQVKKRQPPPDATKVQAFRMTPEEPDLVALYASQATEPAYELSLLQVGLDTPDNKSVGLMTFTLCETLARADGALSYSDLIRLIHDSYLGRGRGSPTPLLEGKDRNKEVLGEKELRGGRYHRLTVAKGVWQVDAGSLHGLTPGSVLAVLPPAGRAGADKPTGYVQVSPQGLGMLEAQVLPCVYNKLPAPMSIPIVGEKPVARCELVEVNHGDLRLLVAVDTHTAKDEPVFPATHKAVIGVLDELAAEKDAVIRRADSPAAAQWLLRFDSLASGKLHLVPVAGGNQLAEKGRAGVPSLYGPVPEDERAKWLKKQLTAIARFQALLTTMSSPPVQGGEGVQLRCEVVRLDAKKEKIAITRSEGGVELHDQDRIAVTIHNDGREPIDITVLYLTADYGISAQFPKQAGNIDNRVTPKGTPLSIELDLSGDPCGWERLVVIAVKAKPVKEYANFSFLAQPDLERARDAKPPPDAGSQVLDPLLRDDIGVKSPLDQLLRSNAFGLTGRGEPKAVATEYAFSVHTWKMLPNPRPEGGKK